MVWPFKPKPSNMLRKQIEEAERSICDYDCKAAQHAAEAEALRAYARMHRERLVVLKADLNAYIKEHQVEHVDASRSSPPPASPRPRPDHLWESKTTGKQANVNPPADHPRPPMPPAPPKARTKAAPKPKAGPNLGGGYQPEAPKDAGKVKPPPKDP